jgi:tetratricopeptide (TPR) repeat protein
LAHHFFQAGELEKGLIYSIQAAAQARAIYAHETALYWYTQALDAMDQLGLENLTQQQRFELLLAREQALHHLGNRTAQLADLSSLQSLGQALNEASKQAIVHNRRAACAYATNHLDEAATEARAGLIAATQAGQAILVADSLLQTALIESLRGQFDAVRDRLGSVRNALEETDEPQAKINFLNGLGVLYRQLNEFAESEKCTQRALELAGLSRDRYGQVIALSSLGETRRRKGDYKRSLSCQRQALVLNQFISNRPGEATCLNRLASLYRELGFYLEAQELVERAIMIHREIEDEAGLALDFQLLGTILAPEGDWETGCDYLKQALDICQRSGRKVQEGLIWLDLAMTLESMGKLADTGQAYQAAHSIFGELGVSDGELEAEAGLARCFLIEGKAESAQQVVEPLLLLLDNPGRNGVFRYPVRLYLTAYRVLETAESWDKAQAALQQGHDLLQHRANTIEDVRLKASFLENVPENKELLAMLDQQKVGETAD